MTEVDLQQYIGEEFYQLIIGLICQDQPILLTDGAAPRAVILSIDAYNQYIRQPQQDQLDALLGVERARLLEKKGSTITEQFAQFARDMKAGRRKT